MSSRGKILLNLALKKQAAQKEPVAASLKPFMTENPPRTTNSGSVVSEEFRPFSNIITESINLILHTDEQPEEVIDVPQTLINDQEPVIEYIQDIIPDPVDEPTYDFQDLPIPLENNTNGPK